MFQCCNGECPPCEQICNKQLGCRNHKCLAPCHTGKLFIAVAEVMCYTHWTSVRCVLHVVRSACGVFCMWCVLHVVCSACGVFCMWCVLHVVCSACHYWTCVLTGACCYWTSVFCMSLLDQCGVFCMSMLDQCGVTVFIHFRSMLSLCAEC